MKAKSLYFVGIGGIGMSGLARYFHAQAVDVAGYDRTESELTNALKVSGIDITAGQTAEDAVHHFESWVLRNEAKDAAVIRTPAVPSDFPILIAAQNADLPILKRSEVLGQLTHGQPTLAVAGTHGKTTTSAMLAHILMQEPQGCRAFIGGVMTSTKSNVFWSDQAQWTVVEADEFDRSFLHLQPTHAAITSADPDHLDIYGDLDSFHQGFRDFARQVNGNLWMESGVGIDGLEGKRYGIAKSAEEAVSNRWSIAAIQPHVEEGWMTATVWVNGETIPSVRFPLPGRHNVLNGLAAIALADEAGIPASRSVSHLSSFQGIERRFAYQIRQPHGVYIDDYAHHPAELEAAIEAARSHHPDREITGIFQPHLFTRTRDHLEAFGHVLSKLDRIFLLPIYPAREAPIPGIDSQTLFENIPNPSKHLIESHQIFDNLKEFPPEVLMTLGAGDIDRLVKPLFNWLQEDPLRFKQDT
jgi:UDP-N-acetylmuramate--alanine ligase